MHTPGRNAQAVAELAIAQLLALARHTTGAERYVREGRWADIANPCVRFQGRELGGPTLGLVGFGAVGQNVARIAVALGMRVIAYDPYVTDAEDAKFVTLYDLLRLADFVVLLAPDTEESAGMIDAKRIRLLKPGALLVNVASPHVVDRQALAEALADERVGGAGFDVHEAQPILPGSAFLGLPSVQLTPHIGSATRETVERHFAMVAEDIERFAAGEKPLRLANPDMWG